jgi:hypothetical protein
MLIWNVRIPRQVSKQHGWLINPEVMSGLSVDVDYESHLVCLVWGAEKTYLKSNFPGLKWRNNQDTLIWEGEEARFIINNL